MNRSPSRTRGIVLAGLAILVVAGVAFAVRRPLLMAAPRCMAGRWHGCFDTFNGVLLMSHRIRLEGRRDEFRELSDAFDSMLARLEASVAEQQRFAANASHELRTPLAVSRTLLDVARNDPAHHPGELIARLHAVNERATDLTVRLPGTP